MTEIAKGTWETINLPSVTTETIYKVYNRTTSNPGTDTAGLLFQTTIEANSQFKHLEYILSSYLYTDEPSFVDSFTAQNNLYKRFFVYWTQAGDFSDTTADPDNFSLQINLTYNWSYDDVPSGFTKSNPVFDILDYRQFFLYSTQNTTGSNRTADVNLGGTTLETITLSASYINQLYIRQLNGSTIVYPGEFNFEYSYDFFINTREMIPGTFVTLTILGKTFYVTNTCYRYCLYYANSLGGWDSLLFGGKQIQTDNFQRLSYLSDYEAGSYQFGQRDYTNKVTETWELNTSWLNDLQSEKMKELFQSNKIFLHDLSVGKITPVNITNTSQEHKTYHNQDNKLYGYTINVKSSQSKYRL